MASSEDEKNHLRAVWRNMVEATEKAGGLGRSIFMSDLSGSMQHSGAGDTPYWASLALGRLGSQTRSNELRAPADLFNCLRSVSQGLSTDFQKAMELVLKTPKEARMQSGNEPENLIVLTDMNFGAARNHRSGGGRFGFRLGQGSQDEASHVKTDERETHVTMLKESFKHAGEQLWGPGGGFTPPRIVLWNLAANPSDFHATADTLAWPCSRAGRPPRLRFCRRRARGR